jgi:hypothetical protein
MRQTHNKINKRKAYLAAESSKHCDMPPSRTLKRKRASIWAQISPGLAVMLAGSMHLLVSEPDDEDEDIGILYLMLGGTMYEQEVADRRRKRRGGRYGPRGPYKKNRSQEFIDALIDKATDRFFKNWFR